MAEVLADRLEATDGVRARQIHVHPQPPPLLLVVVPIYCPLKGRGYYREGTSAATRRFARWIGNEVSMSQFSPLEIANWTAIYLATAMCCAIAMMLSVSVTVHGLWKDQVWGELRTARGAALFFPKIWWRWQKLYILSTPVTLAIVGWFAATMRWS